MEAFIRASACISHPDTFSEDFDFEQSPLKPARFLTALTPVPKDLLPATTLRRASHVLKMGLTAGLSCLKRAGLQQADAIIVGTAQGCYEDTDKFLMAIADNQEEMLPPTHFIQSTHNTVAGQLALITKSTGYNLTYVHQNLSFEYALLDALLLMSDGEAEQVLVGGVDELPAPLQELFDRAGHIKRKEDLHEPMERSTTKGYVAGEGAVFFCLEAKASEQSLAKILGVKTLQKTDTVPDLLEQVLLFLKTLQLRKEDIDLVLSGINGDCETDRPLNQLNRELDLPVGYFKHLCGEYFTASAFALWLATSILQKQKVPGLILAGKTTPARLKHLLIINHSLNGHYSFICVSAC